MDTDEQIFGLIEAAQQQQAAVTAELEALRQAIAQAVPAVERAAAEAVALALGSASKDAVAAVGAATLPLVASIRGAVQAAGVAERSLTRAGQWFAWKWVAVAGAGLAGVCLVAYGALAWQLRQVDQVRGEMAGLTATVDDLVKRGGRAQLLSCGPRQALCVRVEKGSVFGKDGDFMILKGY